MQLEDYSFTIYTTIIRHWEPEAITQNFIIRIPYIANPLLRKDPNSKLRFSDVLQIRKYCPFRKVHENLQFRRSTTHGDNLIIQQRRQKLSVFFTGHLSLEIPSRKLILVPGRSLTNQLLRGFPEELQVVLLGNPLTLYCQDAVLGPLPKLPCVRPQSGNWGREMADLRARYFCGGSVLHEVVERHASNGAEPSLHISKPNFNILTNTLLGNGAGHVHVKQVHCRDTDILTALEYLVGCWHVLVEHIRGNLRQCGMSDPGQLMLILL